MLCDIIAKGKFSTRLVLRLLLRLHGIAHFTMPTTNPSRSAEICLSRAKPTVSQNHHLEQSSGNFWQCMPVLSSSSHTSQTRTKPSLCVILPMCERASILVGIMQLYLLIVRHWSLFKIPRLAWQSSLFSCSYTGSSSRANFRSLHAYSVLL